MSAHDSLIGDGFDTFHEAIKHAKEDDTITFSGEITENVHVDKKGITLDGKGKGTIISEDPPQFSPSKAAVLIDANNVKIKNCTLKEGISPGNSQNILEFGDKVSDTKIENVHVESPDFTGDETGQGAIAVETSGAIGDLTISEVTSDRTIGIVAEENAEITIENTTVTKSGDGSEALFFTGPGFGDAKIKLTLENVEPKQNNEGTGSPTDILIFGVPKEINDESKAGRQMQKLVKENGAIERVEIDGETYEQVEIRDETYAALLADDLQSDFKTAQGDHDAEAIVIKDGIYKENQTLTVTRDRIRIISEDSDSTIKAANGDHPTVTINAHHVELVDLEIKNNEDGPSVKSNGEPTGLIVDDCNIEANHRGIDYSNGSKLTVKDSHIEAKNTGIDAGSEIETLEKNTIDLSGESTGIHAENASNATISENTITQDGSGDIDSGIVVDGNADDATISENTIEQSSKHGIKIGGAGDGIDISENEINASGGNGIVIGSVGNQSGSTTTIEGNTVRDVSDFGIDIRE